MDSYFKEILEMIVPSKEEEKKAWKIINEFKSKLEEYLPEVLVGGSFGKGTWLKGTSDVDLFIRFPKDGRISDKVEDALKKLGVNYIRIRGSRDYFKVFYENFEFELVPILKISKPEEAKNVTDLSPFHIAYVREKIKEKPYLVNEIRLTKAFMKAIGVYGAESYINGFSGYACEVLTIYYNSFLNLVKNASNWRPKVIIDPESFYKNKQEIINKLNIHRLQSPIVIIDPVCPARNVTASVSTKSFAQFIFYARRLLEDINKHDIKKYFVVEQKTENYFIEKCKRLGTNLVVFEVIGKGNNLDVKNTKILKFLEFIKKQLTVLGFTIIDYDIIFQKDLNCTGKIYLYIYPNCLPEYELKSGPPVWVKEHAEKFYKKWVNFEVKISPDGRLLAIAPRRIKTLQEAISFIFNNFKSSIEDKVEKVSYSVLSK